MADRSPPPPDSGTPVRAALHLSHNRRVMERERPEQLPKVVRDEARATPLRHLVRLKPPGGVKRGSDSVTESSSKRLRMIADEHDAMLQEKATMKETIEAKTKECDKLKARLLWKETMIRYKNEEIDKSYFKQVDFEDKVAELNKQLKDSQTESRQDKTKLRTLQNENDALKLKLEKAKKGWQAFKEIGDILDG